MAPAPALEWTSSSSSDGGAAAVSDSSGEPAVDSVPPQLPRYSDEAGPSRRSLIPRFVAMGFPEALVVEAVENNEEGNENAVLQTLLNSGDVEKSGEDGDGLEWSSSDWDDDDDDDDDDHGDNADVDEVELSGRSEEVLEDFTERDEKLATLVEMGFHIDVASVAIKRCGEDASIIDLTDFIYAADMAENSDLPVSPITCPNEAESCIVDCHIGKKRRRLAENRKHFKKSTPDWKAEYSSWRCLLPNPMIGFGLPGESSTIIDRKIHTMATGPPYFYFENVALTPPGVWEKISSNLFEIEPEFVDSKSFSASARKRGYIHNLPIRNRFPIQPIPPKTIREALPWSAKWMPKWDKRVHFNCLQGCVASAKNTGRIRNALSGCGYPPPADVQKYVLKELRTWNLVWVGPNKVAPLEPDEMEILLGFPSHHTRGVSRTDRYRALGSSFQIDTVAFHLSVLKNMFPHGIRVLSLFSGIGGAEVAMHRLGIPLNVVVSVEICQSSRSILRNWWDQNQTGTLIHLDDVQQVNTKTLEELCDRFGGFDLVIGGSPCNNLSGSNRHTRHGLEGEHSSLFFDYCRILEQLQCIMRRKS